MAMHDEVKEQQNKLKGKSFREKIDYFWYYYKVHTIVAVFTLIVAGIFIKDALTAKDYAFSATVLNAYGSDSQEELQQDFARYAGIDTDKYDCFIDVSSTLSYETMSQIDLAVSQRVFAMAQTNGMDVLISDSDPFSNFAEGMMFTDLREELSDKEYAEYEKDFFYIDAALIDSNNNEMIYDEDGMPQIVDTGIDHTNPDAMKDPMPVGIYLRDSAKLKAFNCYPVKNITPIFGFVYSSEKKDTAHQFLHYLTE